MSQDHSAALREIEQFRKSFVIAVGDKSPFAKQALALADRAIAALAQPQQPSGWRDIAPKGWKLVPVEPTNAMLNASLPSPILSWGAMLAAAPSHPAEQQECGDAMHPNHIPDLRYILAVLERLSKGAPKDGELSAAVNGMRYVVSRTERAAMTGGSNG